MPLSLYLTHRVQAAGDLLPKGLVLRRNAHLPWEVTAQRRGKTCCSVLRSCPTRRVAPRRAPDLFHLGFSLLGQVFSKLPAQPLPQRLRFAPGTAPVEVAGVGRGEGTALKRKYLLISFLATSKVQGGLGLAASTHLL